MFQKKWWDLKSLTGVRFLPYFCVTENFASPGSGRKKLFQRFFTLALPLKCCENNRWNPYLKFYLMWAYSNNR